MKKQAPIAVVGVGYPAKLWEARLEQAKLNFARAGVEADDPKLTGHFNFIIETDDPRYGDDDWTPPDMEEDADEDIEELEFWEQENGHGASELLDEDAEGFTLTSGGVVLVPCYSASPTEMAAAMDDWAARTVGYTLFPAPPAARAKPVIELARPMQTEDDAWKKALGFAERSGLRVEIAGDAPGLVFGRTVACLINEAALALGEGIAGVADIDRAMQLGVNYPKGLFEWADEIGLDLVAEMMHGLYMHYQEDRYRLAPMLHHMSLARKKFTSS